MKISTDAGWYRAKSSAGSLLNYWRTFQKMVWKMKEIRR